MFWKNQEFQTRFNFILWNIIISLRKFDFDKNKKNRLKFIIYLLIGKMLSNKKGEKKNVAI